MILEFFMALLETYGYFGIFLVNLIAASTIIFPLPSSVFVFAAGAFMNPFLVGLFAALGCTVGEFSGYALGLGGRKVIKKKWEKWITKTEKWFQKYGAFWIIVLFAATPLPDDVVGVLSGVLNYPLKRFFIASFIGKLILNLALAYGGLYGIKWILGVFSPSA
jgi:membrane protein YqaA with SNARE-associated domain